MSGITTNASAQGHLARLERQKRQRQEEDLRLVMATAVGRRLVIRLIDEVAGVWNLSFVAGYADATAFNDGKRSVGVVLAKEVQALVPELWTQAQAEAQADLRDEREKRDAAKETKEDDDG